MLYIIDVAPRDPGFITMKGVRIIKKRDIEAGWVGVIDSLLDLLVERTVVRIRL